MLTLTSFFTLVLISAANVMSLFLSLVGFSIGLYVLLLSNAGEHPSREATLKYYYLSALSSGLILYGLIVIYIIGTTGDFSELFILVSGKLSPRSQPLASMAILFTTIGFFFKLSTVPGHL